MSFQLILIKSKSFLSNFRSHFWSHFLCQILLVTTVLIKMASKKSNSIKNEWLCSKTDKRLKFEKLIYNQFYWPIFYQIQSLKQKKYWQILTLIDLLNWTLLNYTQKHPNWIKNLNILIKNWLKTLFYWNQTLFRICFHR